MRQEIADQMAPAPGNNAAPVLGILLKLFSLKRIDLIADQACYSHKFVLVTESMALVLHPYFVYNRSMVARQNEGIVVAGIAAAIGEPARTRILYCLLDAHARTSTELAVVAEVSPSTASVHLQRLMSAGLIKVSAQGKHRYYGLADENVAKALEALSLVAGAPSTKFVPNTPNELRFARTCYDHLAGRASVLLLDRFKELRWLTEQTEGEYQLTPVGCKAFEKLGMDVDEARNKRRRFAYACVDWSERQPHLGGALGSALLQIILKRKWATRDLASRALEMTRHGKREMLVHFGIQF